MKETKQKKLANKKRRKSTADQQQKSPRKKPKGDSGNKKLRTSPRFQNQKPASSPPRNETKPHNLFGTTTAIEAAKAPVTNDLEENNSDTDSFYMLNLQPTISSQEETKLRKQKEDNVAKILAFLNSDNTVHDIQDDHPFFSKLETRERCLDGLKQKSFVPQSISQDVEDNKFKQSTQSISKFAREYISMKKNKKNSHKESDIIVFDGSTQKKQVTLKRSDVMEMYEKAEWLNTKLIDAYLSNLVLPDLHRYKHSQNCKCHYVDMAVIKATLEESITALGYTNRFEKLLKKQMGNPNDYDMIFFGGTDGNAHFFLLALMPARNEFYIIDSLAYASTNLAVANFLYIFLQHYEFVKDNKTSHAWKGFAPTYDFEKSNSRKNIRVFKPKPGSKFVPMQKDSFNCGFFTILNCESLMRGIIPSIEKDHLKSIRDNGHLLSSLATGVCLMGNRSVYSASLLDFCRDMSQWQRKMLKTLPKQYCFNAEDENYESFGDTNFIYKVVKPCSFQTFFYHDGGWFNIPGKKLFTKKASSSLLCCYGHFVKSINPLMSQNWQTENDLEEHLLKRLLNDIERNGTHYFDVSQNDLAGMLDDGGSFPMKAEMQKFAKLGFFGFKSVETENAETTKEWIENIVNEGSTSFTDSDHAIPMHFHFCELFKTKLVVYTHQPGAYKLTTSIFAPMNDIEGTVEHYDGLFSQDFNEFPNQILAYKPQIRNGEEGGNVWHFDVITPDLETEDMGADNGNVSESEAIETNIKKTPKNPKVYSFELNAALMKEYKNVRKLEVDLEIMKSNQKQDTFLASLPAVEAKKTVFNKGKKALEKMLKEANCANYESLKKREIREKRLNTCAREYYKVQESDLKGEEKRRAMLEVMNKRFGDTLPKLSSKEKREHKKFTSSLSRAEKKAYDDDQTQATQIKRLRYMYDDDKYKPYWEGIINDPNTTQRSRIILNLNYDWLISHFNVELLNSVKELGKMKINNELIARDKRWMDVPLGFNDNKTKAPSGLLYLSNPMSYPQGTMKTCLYTSVASALVHMGHSDIAEHIVANMMEGVGVSAKKQWEHLIRLMSNLKMSKKKVQHAKFNFRRGKKRSAKHKLDVEKLQWNTSIANQLYAVALIGSDGGEDHAVAVVDGKIFDSSATHAMHLCRKALDWCCNCDGGYSRTGHAVRFSIPAKKDRQLRNLF